MKIGETIYANTHAEFLNEAFGTNYKQWMRCTWRFDDRHTVWMVRFNKKDGGWKNTFIANNQIKEENLEAARKGDIGFIHKRKIVIEIADGLNGRKYIFRGVYLYNEEKSDPYTVRYYDKVADEI